MVKYLTDYVSDYGCGVGEESKALVQPMFYYIPIRGVS